MEKYDWAATDKRQIKAQLLHKKSGGMKRENVNHVSSVFEMLCAVWYHLYNLENVKNTHGGVVLLVKVIVFHGCFSRFKLCKLY